MEENNTVEIWKDIEGYESMYQVSNFGNVRSLKKTNSIILKGRDNTYGYLKVALYKNNSRSDVCVHRLTASAFLINHNNYSCVNHINGIKTDNRVENLEWSTQKENVIHALKNGLLTTCKLTEDQVSEIINIKGVSSNEIAQIYGVSPRNIRKILRREIWKHL